MSTLTDLVAQYERLEEARESASTALQLAGASLRQAGFDLAALIGGEEDGSIGSEGGRPRAFLWNYQGRSHYAVEVPLTELTDEKLPEIRRQIATFEKTQTQEKIANLRRQLDELTAGMVP